MPGMYLAVVAVAAMSVMGGGITAAMVEETATAAAEELNNGLGRWWLCSVFYFIWVVSVQCI
jgi:hypothetical protein